MCWIVLLVTYVFICEGSARARVELWLAGAMLPPGVLLGRAQEIGGNAKLLPNSVRGFISSDTGRILAK